VNVSTSAFEDLTAQVAELTEQVRRLAAKEFGEEMFYAAGRAHGETAAREAMLGRAAKTSRAAAPRPSHLRAVPGGPR
jgi:hypothetical protein